MNILLDKNNGGRLSTEVRGSRPLAPILNSPIFNANYSTIFFVEEWNRRKVTVLKMTTSGVDLQPISSKALSVIHPVQSTQQAVNELRRISGLTWDQLAQLFDVSRRSIHFWASGQTLSSKNEEKLNQILNTLRYISLGSGSLNRSLLMKIHSSGISYLEMLAAGEYSEVRKFIGAGNIPEGSKSPQLSKKAEILQVITNPGDLADALQETVHREVGRSRVAKSVRSRKHSDSK
jgi:DNA-binding transcriptional regulator YiaG